MFFGSIPALITPFSDGQLDLPAYADFIEWQIESGSHGLVPCGTTGEAATLSFEEHRQIVETCIQTASGRVPVIAGAGSNSTSRAVEFCHLAKQLGADAVLVAAPWYNKPSQNGIFAHFEKVSSVGIPVVAYNVPGRTVVDISVETMGRIAQLENVIGVKDATGDIGRVQKHRKVCGGDFLLLSGDDPTSMAFYQEGGLGCISVTANVLPAQCANFHIALRENDMQRAAELDLQLQDAHASMFVDASPAPAKYALSKPGTKPGRIKNELRLPMLPCSQAARQHLDKVLAPFGV